MDVKSFYSSLNPEKIAKIARIMWQESPLVAENVDYDELAKYFGMNVSHAVLKNEKLLDLVYRKRNEKYKKKKLKKKSNIENEK